MTGRPGEPPRAVGRRARTTHLWAIALALLAAAVYANSLANGFAWDDVLIVQDNEAIRNLAGVPDLFTRPYWPSGDPARGLYRPVTLTSFAIDWALGGGRPLAFHVLNVLLHAGVTVLVLLLLRRVGAPLPAASAGAAVFAVHPVHTEAVANVVGRAELLVALFTLLGALAYLRYAWGPLRRTALVACVYALALGAKENALVFPALLFLLELLRPNREAPLGVRLRREWPVYAALGLVAALYLAVRYAVLGVLTSRDVAAYLVGLPASTRVATALRIVPEYVRLLVFPRDLVADYGPAVIMAVSPADVRVWFGLALMAGALALAWAWRRERPLVTLAVLWLAIAIFPVSNLLVPVGVWLAERALYLPSIGVALLVAAIADAAARSRTGVWLGAAALLVALAAGTWRTWVRNPVWRSSDAGLDTLIEEHPESYRSQWALGVRLASRGALEPALRSLEHAIGLVPNETFVRLDQAEVLLAAGRAGEAEAALRPLVGIVSRRKYVLLGHALARQGRPAEAAAAVEEGLRHYPDDGALRRLRERLAPVEPRHGVVP